MKIELEIQDIKTFADGLNNAIVAYLDIINSIQLCCHIPEKMQGLQQLEEAELNKRFDCLKDVYNQVLVIEKESKHE